MSKFMSLVVTPTSSSAARACKCDSCGATREKSVKDDGWKSERFSNSVANFYCPKCVLVHEFSDNITTSAQSFLTAVLSAVHPSLQRTFWDSLQVALHNIEPTSSPASHEADVLEQFADFKANHAAPSKTKDSGDSL